MVLGCHLVHTNTKSYSAAEDKEKWRKMGMKMKRALRL